MKNISLNWYGVICQETMLSEKKCKREYILTFKSKKKWKEGKIYVYISICSPEIASTKWIEYGVWRIGESAILLWEHFSV